MDINDMNTKAAAARTFDRVSATYDQLGQPVFARFGRLLVDAVEPATGERVLDVATGRGAALLPAASAVGPGGCALGVDISAGMLRHTAATVRRLALGNVALAQQDAERLAVPGATFDVATAAHCLLFFTDLFAVLGHVRRALKPGGRLGISGWGLPDERWAWLAELGLRRGNADGAAVVAGQNIDWLELLLDDHGFAVRGVHWHEVEHYYADEQEWWAVEQSHGGCARLEALPRSELPAIRRTVNRRLGELRGERGIPYRYRSFLVVADRC